MSEIQEPTYEMMRAGYDATRLEDGTPQFADAGFCIGHARSIYVAMVAATPRHRSDSMSQIQEPTYEIVSLLQKWQEDQCEWFCPTVLEVVAEYAVWRESGMQNNDHVERVARAIYEAADDKHAIGWPWDKSIYGGKEYWLKLARASLATPATSA